MDFKLSSCASALREYNVSGFCIHVAKVSTLPLVLTLIFYIFQTPREVDVKKCTCDCWDGRFKGPYGRGGYKSMYFSIESETGWLFLNIILFFSLGEKALWKFVELVLEKKVRVTFTIILVSTVYPMFYGSWMFFNYINDRFYLMYYSQMFFTFTELVNAGLAYRFLDSSITKDASGSRPRLIVASWVVITICTIHIIQSGGDQMFFNFLRYINGRGFNHTGLRDLSFFICDISQILAASYQIWILMASRRGSNYAVLPHGNDEEPDGDDSAKKGPRQQYSRKDALVDARTSIIIVISCIALLRWWSYHK